RSWYTPPIRASCCGMASKACWRRDCSFTAGSWPADERYTWPEHSAMRRNIVFALLLVAALRLGSAQTVTWSEHIAPIVYNNCTSCHRPGQVSPLPLMNYDDVRRRGSTISQTVEARFMPPWK